VSGDLNGRDLQVLRGRRAPLGRDRLLGARALGERREGHHRSRRRGRRKPGPFASTARWPRSWPREPDAFGLLIREVGRLEGGAAFRSRRRPRIGFAILARMVLLYLLSNKPGWFACLVVLLVVGILIAGCG
jgi:hypothetical protein